MKGKAKVIALLNEALCAELTAINQYFISSKMSADWGFQKLADKAREESIEEMKHAEDIMNRILFLGGAPNMQKYMKIMVGQSVKEQFEFDLKLEAEAVALYNKAIKTSRELGDNGSADLFETLLKDEEQHVDWIETQLSAIKDVGIQNYLAQQL